MEGKYSIKDIERLTGVMTHTLRVWEKRYGIPTPSRSANNFRVYSDDELKYLLVVAMLVRAGEKISHIANLSVEELNNHASKYHKLPKINRKTNDEFVMAMLSFDEASLNASLSSLVVDMGLENAMINIVFPFMSRIGDLWETNSIQAAHEHFFSNVVRQKLISAIDELELRALSCNQKTIVVAGFPADPHELALLFASWYFRSKNWRTIYLGLSVPVSALAELCRTTNLEAMYLHSVIRQSTKDLTSYLKEIRVFFDGKIVLGGNYSTDDVPVLQEFARLIQHPHELEHVAL